jgi:hypothetical protein
MQTILVMAGSRCSVVRATGSDGSAATGVGA